MLAVSKRRGGIKKFKFLFSEAMKKTSTFPVQAEIKLKVQIPSLLCPKQFYLVAIRVKETIY